ncbi:MAG: hypothetical protein JXB47_00395 [Anaerolineae bacterium]|nr:hypothetical protein [Anaerolineae bacterium]
MSKPVALYYQDTGALITNLNELQFDILTYYLNLAGENTEQPDNHKVNRLMLDVIEREAQRFTAEGQNLPKLGNLERGARSEERAIHMHRLVDIIRGAMDEDQTEILMRWEEG